MPLAGRGDYAGGLPMCVPCLVTPDVCPYFSPTYFPFLVTPKNFPFLVTPVAIFSWRKELTTDFDLGPKQCKLSMHKLT